MADYQSKQSIYSIFNGQLLTKQPWQITNTYISKPLQSKANKALLKKLTKYDKATSSIVSLLQLSTELNQDTFKNATYSLQ